MESSTATERLSAERRPWRRRRYDVRINLPLQRSLRDALEKAAIQEDVSPCVVARRGIESELNRLGIKVQRW